MTKVDIISGFLGAGKTTLIKKLLKEALEGQQTVLIENEFGEIGIDGGFLKEAGIEIREMNSGCICCSLVGDFTTSLREVLVQYHPDRIIIEPSGVGKLSDVIVAVQKAMEGQEVEMNSTVAVVDVLKCKMYMKNFGEFFNNQIESAGTVILSRTGAAKCTEKKMNEALELIRSLNAKATVITTDWEKLEGSQILATMEATENMEADLLAEMVAAHEEHEHEHHHHHHHDGEECTCGHHHHEHEEHDHDHEHEHDHEHDHDHDHDHEHHHHHHDGEECSCGHHHDHDHEEHEHDHEHDHEHHHHHHHDGEECSCGHHHDHHADEIFTSWGCETPKVFSRDELDHILCELTEKDDYGIILRSKGMIASEGSTWLYFDMVPEEYEIREGKADVTGKIVVIGAQLKEDKLKTLFGA